MIHDELLSNAEWDAKIAEIGANSFRMVGAFKVVAGIEIVKTHGWIPK